VLPVFPVALEPVFPVLPVVPVAPVFPPVVVDPWPDDETPPPEDVDEPEPLAAVAPGCSWATTTPMPIVAPIAASAAPRVRVRSLAWAFALLCGVCGCSSAAITGHLSGGRRHPTIPVSTPSQGWLWACCDIVRAMADVNTVRGPVGGDRLGRTLMHEHIFVLSPEIEKPAGEWDEEAERSRAVAKLRELKAAGIDTLVDLTVIGLGRYVPRVVAIANEVPEINVVVATGVYTYNDIPMYFHFRGPGTVLGGPEPMVDVFVREITEGIGDTGVRAALLKCATDRPGITQGVERVLRAVARAHRATGVPITTHTPTPPEPWGLEQQRVLRDEGVDLGRVVIGHSGGTTNTEYHLRLIDNGSYLGFDHFGLPGITLEARVDAVARLCARGYAERLVLSHDAMCFVDWFPRSFQDASRDWRWTYISELVLPAMRERGISEDDITTMLVHNPRRILEAGAPY
jgi:phosphotriesterase-related protein